MLILNFILLAISLHFYFWDLLRESYKQYEILLIVLFLGFLIFLASEALLFISFFWASFHSLSSPSLGIFGVEGFYVPDPCQLTFANTLLLSNAAVSLGGAFVSLEISISFLIFFSLFSFLLAWMFISLQIKEFWSMGLHINDNVLGSVFFTLTGLHFFHLVVGLILLSLFFWCCTFSYRQIRAPKYIIISITFLFLTFLTFLWIGAQFPQEKFLSYARILTVHYYVSIMFIILPSAFIVLFLAKFVSYLW